MVAVLMGQAIEHAELEGILGLSASRRDCRHDLPIKPDHSYVTRITDVAISVDVLSQPWHDTCGDDQGPESPVYSCDESHERLLSEPWSLKRAVQHYAGGDDAQIAAANHSAYVLLRVPLQAGGNALRSYNALLSLAQLVLKKASQACFFNPRGEVLGGRERFGDILAKSRSGDLPPLELLVNSRIFDVGAGWRLVDCVGLGQVGLKDQEVVYNGKAMPAEQVVAFVKNLAMHLIRHQVEVENGDTAGGPGESLWEAMVLGQGSISPRRPVIRWLPEDRTGMPLGLEVP